MDNMTAKVSCFARAYHYNNNQVHIFKDSFAELLLGDEFHLPYLEEVLSVKKCWKRRKVLDVNNI